MANKKMTYDLSINGVQQSIKDTTILKQSLSALDKSIITAKFPSKLMESFRSFSDFSKSFSKETNHMEEAITKVVPTLNTASQKINDIAESYLSTSLKKQIDEIENLLSLGICNPKLFQALLFLLPSVKPYII
ncbi:hypothetical protein G7051_12140 [Dysgonomonas sp. HDW5B]|uniref:hypothetical protein n=1 Tax=Dysgonomonas sp. HDW5B TaxID=2714927 RepID=UPI00140A6958|nr:hypothetical protein [Dysgonomonas sp. HDW5B]QIK55049.1 hypothetical protein G7051_12140 [Dysgonomonas sp. HDW5B]